MASVEIDCSWIKWFQPRADAYSSFLPWDSVMPPVVAIAAIRIAMLLQQALGLNAAEGAQRPVVTSVHISVPQ